MMRSLVSLAIILFLTLAAVYTYQNMQSPGSQPPQPLEPVFEYVFSLFIRALDFISEVLRQAADMLSNFTSRH